MVQAVERHPIPIHLAPVLFHDDDDVPLQSRLFSGLARPHLALHFQFRCSSYVSKQGLVRVFLKKTNKLSIFLPFW